LNNSPTLGTWSASSAPTIPGGPSAPTMGTLVAGNGKLTVPFTAPSGNGGSPITDYQYSTDGGSTWTSAGTVSSPIVISGLTNGTSYSVRIRAVSASPGVQSSASSGTPQASAPSAPTISTIESLDSELKVFFTAPSDNGGSSITNYKYSTDGVNYRLLSPGQTTSPIVISKLSSDGSTLLSNGTSYPVTLKAVNSIGDSQASNSSSATPKASQTVTWQPEKSSFSGSELLSFTPYPLASSDGPGNVVYSIADPGTSQCSVDASSGAVTYLSSGVCRVRATAAATSTHKSAIFEFDFTVERVVVAISPVPTPTPTPTVTRAPRSVRPTPTPSPVPSPSAAPTAVPTAPTTVAPESVQRVSYQLGVNFTEQGLPKLAPLESIGLVEGAPIPVSLFPNPSKTALVVEGDGFTISLSAGSSSDEVTALNSDGKLVLTAQSMASFSGTGFKPNTRVIIWLFSDPTQLGSVLTDANGSFEGSLPLPSQIASGEHTVQLNGLTPDGETRSVSVGVVVSEAQVSPISYLPTIALGFLFVIGVSFFWFILFRRRDSEDDDQISTVSRRVTYQART